MVEGRGGGAKIANPGKGRGWEMGLRACRSARGTPDKRARS